jgi:hypothetical protein
MLSAAERASVWDGGAAVSPGDAHMHESESTDPSSDLSKMVLEASEQLSSLLGIEGEETRRRADALEGLVDVHRTDSQMYHEFVSLVSMPSWLLDEARLFLAL